MRWVAIVVFGFAMAEGLLAGESVPVRTKAEVDALIDKDGPTPPAWLNATKLNFPPTLLLHWEKPAQKEPWTANKYLSQYIWSSVNENPGRWKEGLRLLHHVYDLNKDDADKKVTTQRALARMYQNLIQDPLHAAYWWKQSGIDKTDDAEDALELASCYIKLGNKDYPRKIAEEVGHDVSRHGDVIKLWMDLGEYDKALKIAELKAQEDDADVAYLMAGETYRLMGKTKEALEYFQKAIQVEDKKCGRDKKQTKARAQASIDAVKLYDALDLKKVADGTYASDSYGYSGQVFVAVTVKAAKIESVKVTKHTEKQYYGSLTETPGKIIEKQTVKGIDTCTGATITSEAIINASAKALSKGMK